MLILFAVYFQVVFKGCPSFTYQSVCPLSTTTGSMGGSFQFQVEGSGEVIDARVATFTFDVDRNWL